MMILMIVIVDIVGFNYYIIYYLDDNENKSSMHFEDKKFMMYWFEKYIHTKKYKLLDKIQFNY